MTEHELPVITLVMLQETLKKIVVNDTNYSMREYYIHDAMKMAKILGFKTSVYIDLKEPDWPVFAIELPIVGQVSWHMKFDKLEYDNHTTAEKLSRCITFASSDLTKQTLNEKKN